MVTLVGCYFGIRLGGWGRCFCVRDLVIFTFCLIIKQSWGLRCFR